MEIVLPVFHDAVALQNELLQFQQAGSQKGRADDNDTGGIFQLEDEDQGHQDDSGEKRTLENKNSPSLPVALALRVVEPVMPKAERPHQHAGRQRPQELLQKEAFLIGRDGRKPQGNAGRIAGVPARQDIAQSVSQQQANSGADRVAPHHQTKIRILPVVEH